MLFDTAGGVITRYVHGPTGIHMQQNPNGTWLSMMQDGLGSVRGVYSGGVISTQEYSPYGVPLDTMAETDFGFTGEVTDNNGLVFLRARYHSPTPGIFTRLDPFEGFVKEPQSINGYSYVEGNPINWRDPSGNACDKNKSCEDWLDDMYDQITNPDGVPKPDIQDIWNELLTDRCNMWDVYNAREQKWGEWNGPFVDEGCYNTDSDWDGHLQKLNNRRKTLNNASDCYKNAQTYSNGVSTKKCDEQNPEYEALKEWTAEGTPKEVIKPEREGGSKPALPPKPKGYDARRASKTPIVLDVPENGFVSYPSASPDGLYQPRISTPDIVFNPGNQTPLLVETVAVVGVAAVASIAISACVGGGGGGNYFSKALMIGVRGQM